MDTLARNSEHEPMKVCISWARAITKRITASQEWSVAESG